MPALIDPRYEEDIYERMLQLREDLLVAIEQLQQVYVRQECKREYIRLTGEKFHKRFQQAIDSNPALAAGIAASKPAST